MTKELIRQDTQETLPQDEGFWEHLYRTLYKSVPSLVHRYKVSSWEGQEEDLINDIIQETVMRIYHKFLVSPDKDFTIQSIEAFSYTIALHYCLDLQRKEKRLTHLSDDEHERAVHISPLNEDDELTILLETISQQPTLMQAAHIIAMIPCKQRRALLIDLARYNDFTEQPTVLELALAEAGIQWRDYSQPLPHTRLERTRHNALVSLGYRRLRTDFQAACKQQVA